MRSLAFSSNNCYRLRGDTDRKRNITRGRNVLSSWTLGRASRLVDHQSSLNRCKKCPARCSHRRACLTTVLTDISHRGSNSGLFVAAGRMPVTLKSEPKWGSVDSLDRKNGAGSRCVVTLPPYLCIILYCKVLESCVYEWAPLSIRNAMNSASTFDDQECSSHV